MEGGGWGWKVEGGEWGDGGRGWGWKVQGGGGGRGERVVRRTRTHSPNDVFLKIRVCVVEEVLQ